MLEDGSIVPLTASAQKKLSQVIEEMADRSLRYQPLVARKSQKAALTTGNPVVSVQGAILAKDVLLQLSDHKGGFLYSHAQAKVSLSSKPGGCAILYSVQDATEAQQIQNSVTAPRVCASNKAWGYALFL